MMDNVADLIWAKNMMDEFIFVNKAMCANLLKCEMTSQALGKTDLFFAQKEKDLGYQHTFGEICVDSDKIVKASKQAGRFIEQGFVRGEYLILDVNKAPIFDENGKMIGTVGCGRNITKEKNIENQLIRSREQFIRVLNNLTSAVYVVDMDTHNILFVNQILATMFGKSPSDLIGHTCWKVLQQNRTRPCWYCTNPKMMDEKGNPVGVLVNEYENKWLNKVFEITDQVIKWSDDRLVKLTIATDITDRKLSEKEKDAALKFSLEQEKYALVGQVAGKMAHDFNNILGAIMGNAEISLMDCREEETRESLNIILEQTIRGKSLTRNLIAFAKEEEPKEDYFNMNSKIDFILNLLRVDLNGTVVVKELGADLPDLLADPGMIEHALVNIVQNAIHAMSLVKEPKLTIKTYAASGNLFVEMIDNGCGIPEEYYADIYSPSFTLKGSKDLTGNYKGGIKGSGYGMSNVKKYIEKHKGAISFESKVNNGTRFVISIPIIEKELTKKEKEIISQKRIEKGRKILLVEDEPAISKVQYKILTNRPFCHEVQVVQDGQAAMDAYDRGDFDLVSLDYLLPGNLNGLDVYKYIRKKDQKIPIVFVSGNIGFLESMKKLAKKDKKMDHVSKPCENMVYAATINKWLQRQDG